MFGGWQLWKRLVRLPLVLPIDNGFRAIAYPESDISAAFIYYRVPDMRDVQFMRSQLNGGVLIDIGANVGSFSLLVADKIDQAILFEPNPIAAARARENVAINNLSFEVHEVAVSDVTGTVEFEDAGGASPCNRTVVGFETKVPTRSVRCVTLDEFLNEPATRPRVSAVKIDVEGHETSVLRGMQHLLRDGRPKLVMFEYLQRTKLPEALAVFEAAGYKTFELTPGGVSEVKGSVMPLQNLFACPKEIFPNLLG
jgi:FkbM family methyltransferase